MNKLQKFALKLALDHLTDKNKQQEDKIQCLVRIVYNREARYDEYTSYSSKEVATQIVLDAISQTGFFKQPPTFCYTNCYCNLILYILILETALIIGILISLPFR